MFTLKKLKQTNLWGFFLKVTKIIIQPSKDANTATHIRLLYLFFSFFSPLQIIWKQTHECSQ